LSAVVYIFKHVICHLSNVQMQNDTWQMFQSALVSRKESVNN